MMEHNRQRKVTVVSFPKIPQVNLSKNYAPIYSVILQYYDGVHEEDKINVSQLKSSFRGNGEFGPNLSQNYATLYLMISTKDFFEMLQNGRNQQVGKSDVSQLSKKSFLLGQMGNLKPHQPRFLATFKIMIIMKTCSDK